MITPEIMILRQRLSEVQEKKKVLEQIKLENGLDISNDQCYVVLVAQISLLKQLIREFENGARSIRQSGGEFSG
jgi:hypothetical protein